MEVCDRSTEIPRLLDGSLNAQRTRGLLDHVGACAGCRERLTLVGAILPLAASAALGPRPVSLRDLPPARAHRISPRTLAAVVAVFVLTLFGEGLRQSVAQDATDPTLAIIFPVGDVPTRPRIVEITVPRGTSRVEITVQADRATWTHSAPVEGTLRMVLPFPDKFELPAKESDVRLRLTAWTPKGDSSTASSSIRLPVSN